MHYRHSPQYMFIAGTNVDLSIPSELRFLPKDLLNAVSATEGGGDQAIPQTEPQAFSVPPFQYAGETSGFGFHTWAPLNNPGENNDSRLSSWLADSNPSKEEPAETSTGKAPEELMDFCSRSDG